jgi:hypothetical protein
MKERLCEHPHVLDGREFRIGTGEYAHANMQ